MPKERPIRITVNGIHHSIEVEATERLIDVLRNRLDLRGTKEGCGTGDCGACVVIMNGKTVPSCLIHAATLDGSEITTIEGIGTSDRLHPLQEAFIQTGAVQCGFCTPGMIMSAKSLLDSNPTPTREQIREALVGNLCRCTGYGRIVDAVMIAAKKMRSK
jgi:aerobic-type carbon monoxide dehydrogenase small subunit (CoxS/CutS family)